MSPETPPCRHEIWAGREPMAAAGSARDREGWSGVRKAGATPVEDAPAR
jgi:hypothetical protein